MARSEPNDDVAHLRERVARLEQELRASESRFRNLILRNDDAIILVDGAGRVRFANPAAEALFGRARGQLEAEPFGFPLVAGERTELDIVAPGGAPLVAEMRVMATEWEGQPASLAVLRDITDRKRAEEQRLQLIQEQAARAEAERALRERDEFMAVASHELKTPLSTLAASAQLLLRRLERRGAVPPDELRASLGRVDDQARRVARLVGQLLDLSRIMTDRLVLNPERLDLSALVRRVAEGYAAAVPDDRFALRLPVSPLEAEVDPVRIEQVLNNLLDNAVKFSPSGSEIEVHLQADAHEVLLEIRDHGVGVPPDRRSQIFDRFYQAHAESPISGLGLGLFITREIVERHGGQIRAEFPEDGGTRMVVRLPVRLCEIRPVGDHHVSPVPPEVSRMPAGGRPPSGRAGTLIAGSPDDPRATLSDAPHA